MAVRSDGNLHVYMLSVGQGDTSVIVSPEGKVAVIDAVNPGKILDLLNKLSLIDDTIEHLIITHPHSDHFSGGNRLAKELTIEKATLAPFWNKTGMGPLTYRKLIGRLEDKKTNTTFLSGYSRWYPDGATASESSGEDPDIDTRAPYLELLGPANGMVRMLEDADIFNTNHLTIMTRLSWRRFRMVSAGDAQMENWSFFDDERLMEEPCQVLRAAHHGSMNGTQWERIDRLSPSEVIVSSDPDGRHHLPDLIGSAIYAKFDDVKNQMAVLTFDTGTVHLKVTPAGRRTLESFGDSPSDNIPNLNEGRLLGKSNNPTDWPGLLKKRTASL